MVKVLDRGMDGAMLPQLTTPPNYRKRLSDFRANTSLYTERRIRTLVTWIIKFIT